MKAIIFDFDGVIHDTFELIYSINQSTIGLHLTREEYRSFFDGNIYAHKQITAERSKAFFEIQNKAFPHLVMDPYRAKIIQQLAQNHPLFIITSNQEIAIDSFLMANRLSDLFTRVLGQETNTSKVVKFHKIFDEYGYSPSDCIFVTDTLGDVLEGHEVGICTIAVDFGFHDRDRLNKGKPYTIVSNFGELFDVIQALDIREV